MTLEKIKEIKPGKVLDVGCGCGKFTQKLAPYCKSITAVDASEALIKRCKDEIKEENIEFLRADSTKLPFPDNSFDLVSARAVLHHIKDWEKALDEIFRVSSKYVLVEELLEDPRSPEKRNTTKVHNLLLEINADVDYPHYPHFKPETLFAEFDKAGFPYTSETKLTDELFELSEYEDALRHFAKKSKRQEYWEKRIADMTAEIGGGGLADYDMLLITAEK